MIVTENEIVEIERPPMLEIETYRRKRGLGPLKKGKK